MFITFSDKNGTRSDRWNGPALTAKSARVRCVISASLVRAGFEVLRSLEQRRYLILPGINSEENRHARWYYLRLCFIGVMIPVKACIGLTQQYFGKKYASGEVPSKCVTASKACCAVIRQSLHEERHDFFERCCCRATSSCRINHHRHSICIHSRGRVVRAEQYVSFVFGK